MDNIANQLSTILNRIQTAELSAHRHPQSVRLIAVTKQQPISAIQTAFAMGQRAFAENYLQEALPKIAVLSRLKLEWHFIGRIQANKTLDIARHFAWVQSIDRFNIAQRLHTQRPENLPPLQICIEINDSADPNKSGISLNELPSFILQLSDLSRLQLRGLMTMVNVDYLAVAHAFYDLQKQGLPVDTLSMGMSGDFEQAIAAGATMVRIGSNLFGARKSL